MQANIKRLLIALTFFVWTVFVLAAYYATQKPILLNGIQGITGTLWVLLVWILLVINAVGIGSIFLRRFQGLDDQGDMRILLSMGIGLGFQGFAGFLLGMIGLSSPSLLVVFQLTLLLFFVVVQRVADSN